MNGIVNRVVVYDSIDSERNYQDKKWGNPDHDAQESVGNFILYMERYVNKAKNAYIDAFHNQEALEEIRKVAAIAVTCMERYGAPFRVETKGTN